VPLPEALEHFQPFHRSHGGLGGRRAAPLLLPPHPRPSLGPAPPPTRTRTVFARPLTARRTHHCPVVPLRAKWVERHCDSPECSNVTKMVRINLIVISHAQVSESVCRRFGRPPSRPQRQQFPLMVFIIFPSVLRIKGAKLNERICGFTNWLVLPLKPPTYEPPHPQDPSFSYIDSSPQKH